MEWHPGWVLVVQVLVAAGTLGLAVVTFLLVRRTRGMESLTKDALDLSRETVERSARPLLVDPCSSTTGLPHETLLFGAPGRISPLVSVGEMWWDANKDGSLGHFSIALENVGAGVAAIGECRVRPEPFGDVLMSPMFVPVGGFLRVNVSVQQALVNTPSQFKDQWWAIDGVWVEVDYTPSIGGDVLTTIAEIRQYATRQPFVQFVTVRRNGEVLAQGGR